MYHYHYIKYLLVLIALGSDGKPWRLSSEESLHLGGSELWLILFWVEVGAAKELEYR